MRPDGKVEKHVAKYMNELKIFIERELQTRPHDHLAIVGQRIQDLNSVTVGTGLPSNASCKKIAMVTATAGAIKPEEGLVAARNKLKIEGLINNADFIVIETNNTTPGYYIFNFTLTGSAYQCDQPKAQSPQPTSSTEQAPPHGV